MGTQPGLGLEGRKLSLAAKPTLPREWSRCASQQQGESPGKPSSEEPSSLPEVSESEGEATLKQAVQPQQVEQQKESKDKLRGYEELQSAMQAWRWVLPELMKAPGKWDQRDSERLVKTWLKHHGLLLAQGSRLSL